MIAKTVKRGFCAVAAGLLMCACGVVDTAPDQDELINDAELAFEGQACGGIAGLACPAGYACVDDPRDDCKPEGGGADCIGICVEERSGERSACDYNDPAMQYVAKDPEQCALIRFTCAAGLVAFFNECGCGCACESGEC